jgi:hypothetical protein
MLTHSRARTQIDGVCKMALTFKQQQCAELNALGGEQTSHCAAFVAACDAFAINARATFSALQSAAREHADVRADAMCICLICITFRVHVCACAVQAARSYALSASSDAERAHFRVKSYADVLVRDACVAVGRAR